MAGSKNDPIGPLGSDAGRRLDAVYRAEAPRLANMLRGRLKNGEETRDILHEAFARLAGSKPGTALRNPEAYLQRIVRNLLVDRTRHAAKHPVHVPMSEASDPGVPPDQSYAIEAAQMREQYRALVAKLPPRTRQVFLLHRVKDLPYTEIAERLGISVRTVEWHMSEAIAKIAKGLER